MENLEIERCAQVLREMTNPVESIVNLLYLIRHDHKDSKSVLKYVDLADSQARCLIDIVQRGTNF
jgi:hypothetical protein